jgi:hypothetical protein
MKSALSQLFSIAFSGGAGAVVAMAIVDGLGVAGTTGALIATVIAMAVATAVYVVILLLLRSLGWVK